MTAGPDARRPKPSQRPRYRYVAFRITLTRGAPPLSRKEAVDLIQRNANEHGATRAEPWLTRFDGTHGILRVLRGHEATAIRILEETKSATVSGREVAARVEPLLTSGTIAGLERKVFGGAKMGA